MPLYKVTEKRIKKRQREEEDEQALKDAIEVLEREQAEGSASASGSGSEDEDGEESGEDSGEDSEGESEDESVGTMDSEDESSDEDQEEEEGDDEANVEEAPDEGSVDEDDFSMTIPEVSTQPIYALPTPPHRPNTRSCVVCPGKLLSNEHMVTIHLASKSHTRAMSRWNDFIAKAEKEGREVEGDPRFLVEEILDSVEVKKQGGKVAQDADTDGGKLSRRKRAGRGYSKKERKAYQAKKMLEAAAAQTGEKAGIKDKGKTGATTEKLDSTETSTTHGEVKLNRKARRMALQSDDTRPKTPTTESKPTPNANGTRKERRAAAKEAKGAEKRSKQDEKQKAKALVAKQEYARENGFEVEEPKPRPKKRKVVGGEVGGKMETDGLNRKARRRAKAVERKANAVVKTT